MSIPLLLSIQAGTPRQIGADGASDAGDEPWTTGIFKDAVHGPVFVGSTNIEGDAQADRVNHGGRDKAVCAYAADHYPEWRLRPELAAMAPGAFGENFTILGLTEDAVCIGDVWAVGGALVQVSQPRQPCWKLARKWGIREFVAQVVASGRTGWYFRVLQEGTVAAGTPMTLVERQEPSWTIRAANDVMHGRPINRAASLLLGEVASLSVAWRETLARRA